MRRSLSVIPAALGLLIAFLPGTSPLAAETEGWPGGKVIGMYVHQHWPFEHPYAARTWALEDWRGYADGLKRLGYNTVMIWPVLETVPDPPTPSDRANIEKIARVIDALHGELGMRVWLTLCPNVDADSAEAARAPFEKRHFFWCDTRVDPRDPAAMRRMTEKRAALLAPLAGTDAVASPGRRPSPTGDGSVDVVPGELQVDRIAA